MINIPGTLHQLDQLLASDLARVGLTTIVRRVYAFRRQMRPAGYESNEDWGRKFEESFAEFEETLWSIDVKNAKKSVLDDKTAVSKFESSYARNSKEFSTFHFKVIAASSAPVFVKKLSVETIAQGQLLFAAVLRARSAASLEKAASATAIWPFCG